jgi:hypothetical protein
MQTIGGISSEFKLLSSCLASVLDINARHQCRTSMPDINAGHQCQTSMPDINARHPRSTSGLAAIPAGHLLRLQQISIAGRKRDFEVDADRWKPGWQRV